MKLESLILTAVPPWLGTFRTPQRPPTEALYTTQFPSGETVGELSAPPSVSFSEFDPSMSIRQMLPEPLRFDHVNDELSVRGNFVIPIVRSVGNESPRPVPSDFIHQSSLASPPESTM